MTYIPICIRNYRLSVTLKCNGDQQPALFDPKHLFHSCHEAIQNFPSDMWIVNTKMGFVTFEHKFSATPIFHSLRKI